MMTASEMQVAAEAVGRAIISAEHQCFVAVSLDNDEHIPRIRRIASAAARALAELGASQASAYALSEALIEHGKQLFIDEWLSGLYPDEDPEHARSAAIAEFDRIITREGR